MAKQVKPWVIYRHGKDGRKEMTRWLNEKRARAELRKLQKLEVPRGAERFRWELVNESAV